MTRTNERIRVPEVRVIDEQGQQVGVLKIADALAFAQERELDLVEVAPDARPPVCRVLDYSKYKYEQAQKQKAARKHQQQITVREIKFRPKIAEHDYDTKKNHVERFLRHKDKVKVTIMFRGREVTHPERGTAILDRLANELSELAVVEQRPMQEGRNMTMLMAPSKAVLAGRLSGDSSAEGADAISNGVAPVAADAPDAQRATTGTAGATAEGSVVEAPAAEQSATTGTAGATAEPSVVEAPQAESVEPAEPAALPSNGSAAPAEPARASAARSSKGSATAGAKRVA